MDLEIKKNSRYFRCLRPIEWGSALSIESVSLSAGSGIMGTFRLQSQCGTWKGIDGQPASIAANLIVIIQIGFFTSQGKAFNNGLARYDW